ncbi:tyrosine--tRNA ligase [Pseudofrankia sp. BMG5.36]|uniref:tyrosine--tRNA ligase n=1 Tax=Pseudofrankia sp. BMG5.36 TaxID=1834512 RepID=UPI000A9D2528|nr:tyrosine--tRNA ligase [Pseudofrankia sp. BMG5.36]
MARQSAGGEDDLASDRESATSGDVAGRADVAREAAELARGTAQIIPEGGLEARLAEARSARRPLRVKLGVDPSGSDLTLGHAVVLRKLRQFQDHGHIAVLIVGDFTGQIGDPTGRTQTRKALSADRTRANAQTYLRQALKILREDQLELRYNSDWLAKMSLVEVLETSRLLTVARLLERDDFARRYQAGLPISLMEFMYPMLQGMDSVAIRSDIEIGGTDQTYNNLVGRTLQKEANQNPQLILTMPLLRGTDGAEKMGKSLGNWISLNDSPDDQYGKVMSIADDLLTHYAELCCNWDAGTLDTFTESARAKPMEAKLALARRIVELYHGAAAAQDTARRFDERFRRRRLPVDAPEFSIAQFGDKVDIVDLLCAANLAASKSEARRLLAAQAIRLDGDKVSPEPAPLTVQALDGKILQRGKLRAVRLLGAGSAQAGQ